MPLFKSWSPHPQAQAAIWRIEEPEAFFAAHTGLSSDIRHGQRRIEYLAGRFLVQHLWPEIEFTDIHIDENGKPHAPEISGRAFSLSHSFPYVAAVVTEGIPCGIDIQIPKAGIAGISPKYLSENEKALFRNDDENLLWAWSAKEAAYKWANISGISLRDIELKYFCPCSRMREAVFVIDHPKLKQVVEVKGWIEDDFVVAVAAK